MNKYKLQVSSVCFLLSRYNKEHISKAANTLVSCVQYAVLYKNIAFKEIKYLTLVIGLRGRDQLYLTYDMPIHLRLAVLKEYKHRETPKLMA